MLNDREFGEYLKLAGHFWVRIEAHEETSFAVNESHHPLGLKLLRLRLNVKSLRVLHCFPPGVFPADCPLVCRLLTATPKCDEYRAAVRGVSRIWFSFTKAARSLTLGPL